MRRTKVEFIESYIKIDDADYKWNDNHGVLIRCKNCRHKHDKDCPISWPKTNEDYCSFAEKGEQDG